MLLARISIVWIGAILAGLAFLAWIFSRRKEAAVLASAASPTGPSPVGQDLRERLAKAFADHRNELETALPPETKKRVMESWGECMKEDAPDFVELTVHHPRAEEILRMQVDHYMRAYLCGWLARAGGLAEIDARQAAYLLGRDFRDGLRSMGVPLDTLRASLGTSMDRAFGRIVAMGLESA